MVEEVIFGVLLFCGVLALVYFKLIKPMLEARKNKVVGTGSGGKTPGGPPEQRK